MDSSPTRILVIDDDASILNLFRAVLGTARAHPETDLVPLTSASPVGHMSSNPECLDTALSGVEGVRLCERAYRAGRPYAIAFVDLRMAGMDGIETTRRLWAVDPSLLVVTMTGSEKALRIAELAEFAQSDRLLSLHKPLHPVEIRQVARFLDRRKRAEDALQRRTTELDERIKELHCLHAVSRLMEDVDKPLAELLTAIAVQIPNGFQCPERVSARIVLHDKVYACGDFHETPWKLASPVMFDGEFIGALEVCCLEESPGDVETPFLQEEQTLMEDVAKRLGDFIGRHKAEERLRLSEERHRALFESSRDAIMATDVATGKVTAVNPAALALFGTANLQQFLQMAPWDLSPPCQPDGRPSREKAKEMIEQAIRDGSAYFEWRHKRLDGTEFPSTVLLTPLQLDGQVRVQATVRDITEQKRMQAELAQMQRMEAIGQLAAGIAHEINTPTQYIGDNIRFLGDAFRDASHIFETLQRLVDSDAQMNAEPFERLRAAARAADVTYLIGEIPRAVEQSLEGVECVAEIVRAMKDFSHPGSERKVAVDLNRAVQSTLTVCRNEWKYVADLVTDFDPAMPPVPCLPGELNQAILNMVINAAHAIAEKAETDGEKGTITVRTRRNGDSAEIHIQDTGTGIPERVQQKIFDLFFTTKAIGQGTGQGLTMARSIIVDKHSGTVECQSELGRGTTFIVRLPLDSEPDETEVRAVPAGEQPTLAYCPPAQCTA